MEYKMEYFNTASLRWHYPNQVSGIISAKLFVWHPSAFIVANVIKFFLSQIVSLSYYVVIIVLALLVTVCGYKKLAISETKTVCHHKT